MQRLRLPLKGHGAPPARLEVEPPRIFPSAADSSASLSGAWVRFLADLGVRQAFGLVGGAIGPFAEALLRSPIDVIHCRHEGGAAFAAAEASLASQRPTVVFTTTGPGLLNALNGLAAARWDGAHVILVSGCTSAPQRGRWAIQETSAHTLPCLYTAGPLFHYAAQVEDPSELPQVAARISTGMTRPQGFVCHVSLPVNVQSMRLQSPLKAPAVAVAETGLNAALVEQCVTRLSEHKFAMWLGFGARHAAPEIRELVRRSGCGVIVTPRAKGVFPEDDPQFAGVTGLGGHGSVAAYMRDEKPHTLLVLGTRLGEGSSFWCPRMVPPGGFVHVDLDTDAFGAAYPHVPTLGVQAEIGDFVHALLQAWPATTRHAVRSCVRGPARDARLQSRQGDVVRPSYLMQCVQDICIDRHAFPIMAESGNTFAWANNLLRFRDNNYRVSPGYGSMGHFVAGVVGAALAMRRKVVSLVGDGAMLMNCEISTAVRYKADAVWIVLNDGQYGMVEHCMRAQGYLPVETMIPDADFAKLARSQGAHGLRVTDERELADVLEAACTYEGPVVVDVIIDPTIAPPVFGRVESLAGQGAQRPGSRA